MAEQIQVDDFIKQVRELTRGKVLVGFRKKPFFGEISTKFQNGEWYVFDIRHTEKVD